MQGNKRSENVTNAPDNFLNFSVNHECVFTEPVRKPDPRVYGTPYGTPYGVFAPAVRESLRESLRVSFTEVLTGVLTGVLYGSPYGCFYSVPRGNTQKLLCLCMFNGAYLNISIGYV